MRPNSPLTGKKERAAHLVADDDFSDEDIARQCGVNKATLERWKADPDFRARVHEIIQTLQQHLARYSIARKDKRMAAYQDRWERMQRQLSSIPILDTGLLAEMRQLEKQAAQEVGQWMDKSEISAEIAIRRYIGVSVEDV